MACVLASIEQRRYTVSKISFMNYCEYEFRKCGNDWRYCDGTCHQCAMTSTTTTAGSTEIRNNTLYSDRTTDRGD